MRGAEQYEIKRYYRELILKMTDFPTVITIGLLWHSFSSDNLGVGALSESQIAICEAAAAQAGVRVQFIVFGTSGARSYIPSCSSIEIGASISLKEMLTGRSKFLGDLSRCDLVLDIGEGDSFADIYSKRRFRMQIISKLAVILKRKPLILSPQTIGPFDHWLRRRVAVLVMRLCTKVFARDGLSFAYLMNLRLPEGKIAEAIDVAFRLPYHIPKTHGEGGKTRIGVNVSGLLFSGGYDANNQFGLSLDYARLVRDLLTEWCKDDNNEVWLIPHVLSDQMPRDDDRRAIADLVVEFPKSCCAPAFASPSEAKSFIATMDFLTGARMHACIAAFSAGVPVVPFAYSRKFNGLFESLGYPWFVDGKCANNESAKKLIFQGFVKRHELAVLIKNSALIIEERLGNYQIELVRQIQSVTRNLNQK